MNETAKKISSSRRISERYRAEWQHCRCGPWKPKKLSSLQYNNKYNWSRGTWDTLLLIDLIHDLAGQHMCCAVLKLVDTPLHQELKLPDVTKLINLYWEHLQGLWWSIFWNTRWKNILVKAWKEKTEGRWIFNDHDPVQVMKGKSYV